MWKRKLAGTVAVLGLLLGSAIPVYAGDINAEEQRIIDYYNGTVTYEGKTYYFAEWGKQKAYNKLMEDDVDLTAVQVDSAIRQANANLKRGIDEGYLVEVTENGADTQEPDTQTPDSDGKGEGSGAPEQNLPEGSGEDMTGADASQEELTEQKPFYPDDTNSNVQKLLDQALEEGDYADIKISDKKTEDGQDGKRAVTVEQYLKGTVDILDNDGNVILSSGLPIKNTGYYTGGIVLAVVVFAAILCGAFAVVTVKKKKGYFIMPVLTTVAGIAVIAVFAGGFLESQTGKWNALWISGAPEYVYAAESENQAATGSAPEVLPLPGEQYGEILCDEIGLKAPLYYGDTEEILEKGAGTYAGGSLPGRGGSVLVGGHDVTYFAPLESVRKGMILTLKTGDGQYGYEVTDTQIMDVKEYKERKPETEELTLYTCYPFGKEGVLRNERFFVYAKKVSGPEIGE